MAIFNLQSTRAYDMDIETTGPPETISSTNIRTNITTEGPPESVSSTVEGN